jgi:HSP20 family protein
VREEGVVMAEKRELETRREGEVAASEESADRYIRPRTSIYETDDGFRLIMDIPGVSRENLQINFNRGELIVTGRRESWDRENLKSCYCERFDGHYRRVFALDNTLDANKIDAKLSQGVLELTIPKVEAIKPRRIDIKSS